MTTLQLFIQIEDRLSRFLAPRTMRTYEAHARALGGDIATITTDEIERQASALNRYGRRPAPATAQARISAWQTMLAEAVRLGLIPTNPCDAARAPKQPRRLPRAVRGDMRAMDKATDRQGRAALALLGLLGLRSDEALRARPEDIQDGVLRVIGKGDKERAVPVVGQAAEALAGFEPGSPFLSGWSYKRLYRFVGRASVEAGLPRMTPHQFRHGFAVRAAEGGAAVEDLCGVMGHSSISTTMRYRDGAVRDLAGVVRAAGGGA